jgi:hypothetical protein
MFIITEHGQQMNSLLLRGFLAKLGIADCGEPQVLGRRPDGYHRMGTLPVKTPCARMQRGDIGRIVDHASTKAKHRPNDQLAGSMPV